VLDERLVDEEEDLLVRPQAAGPEQVPAPARHLVGASASPIHPLKRDTHDFRTASTNGLYKKAQGVRNS
jgi:hypothetical protein